MKKKILFITLTGYPNPNIGGANKIVFEILKHLDYSKFQPSFFSYDLMANYNTQSDLEINQIKKTKLRKRIGKRLYNIAAPYRLLTSSSFYLKNYYNRIDRYFKDHIDYFETFDVIHIHSNLAANYFSLLSKQKKIFTIHSKGSLVSEILENTKNSKFGQNFIKEFKNRETIGYECADVITFPSEAAMKLFEKDTNTRSTLRKLTKIIYNGVDIKYINTISSEGIFEKYRIQRKDYDIILLNVAAHVKQKNIQLILKAVKILIEKFKGRVLFINSGAGYLTKELEKLVLKLNIRSNVNFLGQIPNTDVLKLMKVCDIFLMPSERVVFDIVLLEAFACNIKILVSKEGGNLEVIQNNINGKFLERLDEFEITDKIIELSKTKRLQKENINIEQYDVSKMVLHYEELYLR